VDLQVEFSMVDRHWLGDIGLAVLLALPLVALVRPQAVHHEQTAAPAAVKVATADRLPGNGRVGLLG
jgi:hypothetical protein